MSWFWYKRGAKAEKTVTNWNAPLPEMGAGDDWRLEALYAWERRLRGYDLFPEPIALEPAFVPYEPDCDAQSGGWDGIPQPRDGWGNGRNEFGDSGDAGRNQDKVLLFFSLRLPVEQKVNPAQTLEFFSMLRGLCFPASLELIADARSIRYQISCAPEDGSAIAGAIAHCFPLAHIETTSKTGSATHPTHTTPDALINTLRPLVDWPVAQCVVDFGLYHPVYRSLKLFETFASDPHSALVGALGSLQAGELAGVQMLVSPAQSGWASSLSLLVQQFDSATHSVTHAAHPNTRDTPLQRALRYKLAAPLWAVSLRVFAFVADDDKYDEKHADNAALSARAFDICRRVGTAFDAFRSDESEQEDGNSLVALADVGHEHNGYETSDRLRDVLDRRTRRAGMLLSQVELAGLWHPPSERLVHPRLVRHDPRHRELPDYLKDVPGVALGFLAAGDSGLADEEPHDGNPQIVRWPDAMRNRHLYMLGATRMGKSTLLLNLICQDMLVGRGLCLIDPHGDLALDVLSRVPPDREDDVFYLDLSDTAHPPAIGLLQAEGEWEKRLLVSDLLAILHRLFQASWGDRLEHILRHALLTLLAAESSPYGTPLTLRDIRPLLASKEYRKALLERVPDPDLHTFWQSEFPSYTASAFAPVYNKLGLLLSSPVVRNIIGGSQTKLHAGPLMRDGQILLVNLAQSLIGEDNAHFLGALLVSKIQLAAMHNLRLGREERQPFTLYVDEFQNFVVSSFEKILSEAGKAGLTLVMANQFLEQLGEGLPTAIRSNTGTLISFRVSAQSGRALEGEFGGLYGAKELTDMERGQAVARLGRSADSFLIHTFPPLEPETLGADPDSAAYIRHMTHSILCRSRGEVEAELRKNDEALRRLLEEAALAEKASKESARETAKEARQEKLTTKSKPSANPKTAAQTAAQGAAKNDTAAEEKPSRSDPATQQRHPTRSRPPSQSVRSPRKRGMTNAGSDQRGSLPSEIETEMAAVTEIIAKPVAASHESQDRAVDRDVDEVEPIASLLFFGLEEEVSSESAEDKSELDEGKEAGATGTILPPPPD